MEAREEKRATKGKKAEEKNSNKKEESENPDSDMESPRSLYERTEPIETEEHHRLHRQTEMGKHHDQRDQSGQDGGNLDVFGGRDHRSNPFPQMWY